MTCELIVSFALKLCAEEDIIYKKNLGLLTVHVMSIIESNHMHNDLQPIQL